MRFWLIWNRKPFQRGIPAWGLIWALFSIPDAFRRGNFQRISILIYLITTGHSHTGYLTMNTNTPNKMRKPIAYFLALIFGPFWLLYVKKYFKAFLFLGLYFIPIVNVVSYIYLIATAGKEAVKYNIRKVGNRTSLRACCNCSDVNYLKNSHCTKCGYSMRKVCPSCHGSNYFNNKFCYQCGFSLQSTFNLLRIFKPKKEAEKIEANEYKISS